MSSRRPFIEVGLDRRQFLKAAGVGAAVFALPSLRSFAADNPAPSIPPKKFCDPGRKMRIACVGCGGKGSSDIEAVSSEEIVALCDVDRSRGIGSFRKHPEAKFYKDYRQMLKEMGDKIDGVVVSTPDHMHFPVAYMAVQMGKHVYVQKPATHTIWEARTLTEAARKYGVVTQMGNQGHANEGTRLLKEWVQSGVIGPVREVHCWTNRPIWPQGLTRPKEVDPVPASLDWNRWLGVAPERPFNKGYLPFNWRGWWDFGCGALGDMACHIMDAAFWALDLKYPTSVEAESEGGNEESAPNSSVITYQFPARGAMPPVTVKWYDGGKLPPRPKGLEEDRKLSKGGQMLIGDDGVIMDTSDYCEGPRLVPEAKMKDFKRPEKTIPRVKGGPHKEWIEGCKGGPMPGSNMEHAGPLTEMVLLGNLAIRLKKKIEWDGPKIHPVNAPEAEQLIRKTYRLY
jgi:predicted dehydrogenase